MVVLSGGAAHDSICRPAGDASLSSTSFILLVASALNTDLT